MKRFRGLVQLLSAVVLVGFSGGAAIAAASCSPAAEATAGQAVKRARAELMAVPVGEMETDVSPAAQAGIERLKDRLRQFVRAEMACAGDVADPKAVERDLSAKGDAFVDHRTYSYDDPPTGHGKGLTYEVRSFAEHPDLRGVVAEFPIECGADAILMLYQRRGDGWNELMVRRSKPYKDISGAYGSFRYKLSPSDRQGRWYLATSRITNWCTSAWQGLRFDLSRPGPTPEQPLMLLQRDEGIYIGNDTVPELRVAADSFEARDEAGSIDTGVVTRTHVWRYRVDGDRVHRIPPVALSARDFVDEWLSTPWDEAAAWSSAEPFAQSARSELLAERKKTSLSFKSVRSCTGGRQQVEIAAEGRRSWFFLVREKPAFEIEAASRRASPQCGGPDIKDQAGKP